MRQYILKQVVLIFSTIFLVTILVFPSLHILPDFWFNLAPQFRYVPLFQNSSMYLQHFLVPASVGGMLSDLGRKYLYSAPWLAIFPGIFISLAVFGFNLLGDGLRDVLDPRLRNSR